VISLDEPCIVLARICVASLSWPLLSGSGSLRRVGDVGMVAASAIGGRLPDGLAGADPCEQLLGLG
jgi:hypothetical protein